jgi:hypothetical protein
MEMKLFANRVMLGLLAFSLLVCIAAAVDVSGTWKGTYNDPAGNSYPISFNLHENTGAVTGTVDGILSPGSLATISNGKVAGDQISFDASGKLPNGITVEESFSGKISGKQIQGAFKDKKSSMPVIVMKE